MSLQHDSPTPLFQQIRNLLQARIKAGEYAVGSRLPSERELAEEYMVSRMTARRALQSLAQEGFTYSRVGKGTYVSSPKINQELYALTSFSHDMRQRGVRPNSRVLAADVRPAPPDVASPLRIPVETPIVVLRRIRLADRTPLALETSHLPHAICPHLLDGRDFEHESLYDVLYRDYGLVLVKADQVIEACMPEESERLALHLDHRTPVLRLTRVTFNDQEHPVEFVRSVYRGDQYQLRAVLRHLGR